MEAAIRTHGLTKHYGSLVALAPLDLEVRPGEVLGCLGPNGAGKTTTIRAILGLVKPTAGRADIFGIDAWADRVAAHRRLAYIPAESTYWPNLSGAETLHLLGKLHGQIDPAYQTELIKRFQFDPFRKVRTYSKGNRQKISLIAALATRAELLIMDEPTGGLDPIMEQAFRLSVDEARSHGQTIFLSSHKLEEVETLCDRVAILRAGQLVELGTLAEMRHLSAVSVTATFEGQPPKVGQLKGVTNVKTVGRELTCQVQGPIAPLLKVLAQAGPKTLLSREPSLEELFLSLYGNTKTPSAKAGRGRH